MSIKKVTSGYEVRFRVNGRGNREYKKVFPTKGECERFQRYTIAQYETQADINPWLEKPKPPMYSFQKSQHTFASHFMMNGGNILTLQKVLGHSDIKMTMRYSHLSPDFLEEATRLNPLAQDTRSI